MRRCQAFFVGDVAPVTPILLEKHRPDLQGNNSKCTGFLPFPKTEIAIAGTVLSVLDKILLPGWSMAYSTCEISYFLLTFKQLTLSLLSDDNDEICPISLIDITGILLIWNSEDLKEFCQRVVFSRMDDSRLWDPSSSLTGHVSWHAMICNPLYSYKPTYLRAFSVERQCPVLIYSSGVVVTKVQA